MKAYYSELADKIFHNPKVGRKILIKILKNDPTPFKINVKGIEYVIVIQNKSLIFAFYKYE